MPKAGQTVGQTAAPTVAQTADDWAGSKAVRLVVPWAAMKVEL